VYKRQQQDDQEEAVGERYVSIRELVTLPTHH